jgi:hypothetical protein
MKLAVGTTASFEKVKRKRRKRPQLNEAKYLQAAPDLMQLGTWFLTP